MRRLYYDFHLHSCLSPCGDDEATPVSVAGFARLAGLHAAALCDHNTSDNCPAFFAACERFGILAIGGMELTTAEDIHLICLFETLRETMEFSREVARHRVLIRNDERYFGRQLVMDEDDAIVRTEEYLLPNATSLTLEAAFSLAYDMSGVCYPAHVDRISNGIIAVLGDMPQNPPFTAAEFSNPSVIDDYCKRFPRLQALRKLFGSDAHRLDAIPDAAHYIELPDTDASSALWDVLRGRV